MSDPDEKKKADMEHMKTYVRYSGLGFQVIIIILLGAWLGKWLDEKLSNDFPALTLTITFLSVFLSMYYLYKKVSSGH